MPTIRQLTEDLRTGTPEAQLRAVHALGNRLKKPENPLIAFWREDREAIQALVTVLEDNIVAKDEGGRNATLSEEAKLALRNTGARAIGPLINALARSDIRLKVVEALWSLQREEGSVHKRIVQQLLDAVWDPATKEGAIAALAHFIRSDLAIKHGSLTLRWIFQSRVYRSHGNVLATELAKYQKTLEILSSPTGDQDFAGSEHIFINALIDMLSGHTHSSVEDRQHEVKGASRVLVRIGDPAVGPLLSAACFGTQEDNKYKAMGVLVRIGAPAVKPLIKILEEESIKKWHGSSISPAAAAAWILGNIGNSQAVDTLVRALKNEDRVLRWNAIDALGQIGDKKSLNPLLDLIEDPECQTRVANALMGSPTLMKHLKSLEEQASRLFCRRCLARFTKREARSEHSKRLTYFVCRQCHHVSSIMENVSWVVVVIDQGSEKFSGKTPDLLGPDENSRLLVNWFHYKDPFDFDEIRINSADDFDVEELVMKVRNDADPWRRSRYRRVPVSISLNHRLSRAKINLLIDTFSKVETKDPWR